MTNSQRDLMFKVMNGRAEVLPYLHHFTHYAQCELILKWLIKSRLVGKEFLDWSAKSFGNSLMGPAQFIISRVTYSDGKIELGRDWVQ